jgi:hypothetical protein
VALIERILQHDHWQGAQHDTKQKQKRVQWQSTQCGDYKFKIGNRRNRQEYERKQLIVKANKRIRTNEEGRGWK